MFAKSKNIALSLIGIVALGTTPATAMDIGVTPSRFEMEINANKTRSQAIRVLNLSSKSVVLKVSVSDWVLNEDNKLQLVAPTEQSLSQWIIFTPSKFTIPARSAQTIRFSIRPKVKPRLGEHRALLYLEEVNPDNQQSKGVKVSGRLGVAIYGYVGDIKRVGVLNSVTVDTKPNSLKAIFDISSQGNAYVRLIGQYAIWLAAKYPGVQATKRVANLGKPEAKLPEAVLDAGLLPSLPILPNNQRKLQLPITKTLPPGNYVLDINGTLGGVVIKKGIPFTVPAIKK
ncbi:fimbrial biogenesis chaperone [Cylindrospermum sp. FACHB-282]|uniref:fimbrial biogenesis chaperone n=1 Tax=Cylindrospermum sp. FACHB-282 TaxID=2692794 RepID=UPI0016881C66|nr:fimbria/pilus periplasmic chaperone [Cylindrospermum sp. FACHB-282]MBD2387970.1 fimbria/pilus periplasmic chaperone [Cylindrospermum sp. FACHB-282]